MALVPCAECNRQISDKAVTCPHCGNPVVATTARTNIAVENAPGKALTTQSTAKVWKVIQLIGFLICVAGVVSCSTTRDNYQTGVQLVMLGGFVFLIGRFGGWWKHG